MTIDYLEKVTEKVLLEVGITQDEYAGLIILMLSIATAYGIGYWFYIRLTCRKINCDKIAEIYTNSRKASSTILRLENEISRIKDIGKRDHENINISIDKVDSAIADLKNKVSELNGIVLISSTFTSGNRRRIEHEDNQ